ncbi:hypothetical protein GpartN1_g3044.t1 [Galdieria partita]|uniref:RRM domain-containing protein n=1 Tax=Galdieria partita TaxID=83374 RepID=A0A9C7PUS3_9RHOD|nr:hypothetical protein GpartN1_g3044.t1 [Galdieria partita]
MTDNTSTIDTEAYLNQVLGLASEKTSEKEDSVVNDNLAESSSKSCGEKDERKSSSSHRSTRRSQSPLKRHKRSRSRSSSRDSSRRRRRKSPTRRRYHRDRSDSPRRRHSSKRESHSRASSLRQVSKQTDEKRSRASSLESSSNDRSKQFRDPEEERKLKEREVDNSFPDYERDLRTIFVWQLAQKVTEKDVYNFFSAAGKVRDIRMIIDKRSGRHKGAAYVEFYYKEAIPSAMRLAGQQLCGYPVAIKPSEAEKNIAAEMAAREAAAAQQARLAELEEWSGGGDTSPSSNPLTFTKLYVGSIHFSISEDDLRTIFEPFGEVISLQLHKDPETGRSRGFGFVQYKNHEDAKKAFEQLNGLDLAGRPLKVGLATAEAQKLQVLGAIPSGVPGTIAAQSLSSKNYAYSAYISELDEGGDSGMALSATQRTQLMQRLARGEALASKSSPASGGKSPGVLNSEASPNSGTVPTRQGYNPPLVHSISPSTCLMLRNMFDPAQETDPNFHLEVQEDVRDECISKFGPLRHIFVDRNSAGLVYVQFETMSDAMKAKQGLHGRWFAGHQVVVEFISESVYYIRFPELKKHSIQY